MRIEYHPEVEWDLKEIRDYYNQCAANLGEEFLNEFEQHIEKIIASPLSYRMIDGDIRRALM